MTAVSRSELTTHVPAAPSGKLRSHGLHAPTAEDLRHGPLAGHDRTSSHAPGPRPASRAGLPRGPPQPTLDELAQMPLSALVTRAVRPAWSDARCGPDRDLPRHRRPRQQRPRAVLGLGAGRHEHPAPGRTPRAGADRGGPVPGPLRPRAARRARPGRRPRRPAARHRARRDQHRARRRAVPVGSHGGRGTWVAEVAGNPIEWSFCATSVRTREPYVVRDVHDDVLTLNPTTCTTAPELRRAP